jgi:hypothetical protein
VQKYDAMPWTANIAASPYSVVVRRMFPQCGFSNTAVRILDAIGATYTTVDVLSDEEIRSVHAAIVTRMHTLIHTHLDALMHTHKAYTHTLHARR